MKKKVLVSLYISICLIILLTNVSFGYLDPSAMTYAIQILSAVVIGITTFIGVIIYKLRKMFSKNRKKNKVVKMNLDEITKN